LTHIPKAHQSLADLSSPCHLLVSIQLALDFSLSCKWPGLREHLSPGSELAVIGCDVGIGVEVLCVSKTSAAWQCLIREVLEPEELVLDARAASLAGRLGIEAAHSRRRTFVPRWHADIRASADVCQMLEVD